MTKIPALDIDADPANADWMRPPETKPKARADRPPLDATREERVAWAEAFIDRALGIPDA